LFPEEDLPWKMSFMMIAMSWTISLFECLAIAGVESGSNSGLRAEGDDGLWTDQGRQHAPPDSRRD
jgi:hypothetical protein